MSNFNEAELKENAKNWFVNEYVKAFVEGDPNFMDHYADQILFVYDNTAQLLGKEEFGGQVESRYVTPWSDAGWTQTSLAEAKITVLGTNTIGVDARWNIRKDDGTSAADSENPGWNYVVLNTGDKWQILSEIESHS